MSLLLSRMDFNENPRPTVRPRNAGQWIYFGNVQNDRIKVGVTSNWQRRFSQHAKAKLGQSIAFEPLCWLRGQATDEGVVKRYFAWCALDGETEVFRPSECLLDYIRWLRDQYYVALPGMPTQEIEALDVADSTMWLPIDETRRKPRPSGVLPGLYGVFDMPPRQITADDFYTNAVVVDAARQTLGSIDLDPASHAIANSVVKATRFYTRRDNGLLQPWAGSVWCNPPFSAWQEWVPKILSEWRSGRVKAMCVLSAMRTVTARYFSPLLEGSNAMCIMHGRIKFWGGVAGDSPDDGHAVFYFGRDTQTFGRSFSSLGTVFVTQH